jgi:hypothetical protein
MTNLDDNRHSSPSQVTGDDDPSQWVDVDDSDSIHGQEYSSQSRAASPAPSGSAVRRRAGTNRVTRVKSALGAAPSSPGSHRKTNSTPRAKPSSRLVEDIPPVPYKQQQFSDALAHGSLYTAHYVLDVVAGAISLLRKPLTFALFMYILLLIITRTFTMVQKTFAPLCILPGISGTAMCYLPPPSMLDQEPQKTNWQNLVDVQARTFEQLFDDSVAGAGLALEIKKAEMASSDLATVVRVSDLRSKEVIADTLSEFINDAKSTGRGLQKLTSKVAGAVDR